MARTVVKTKQSKSIKLKRLKINGYLWGGYRGNPDIAWNMKVKSSGFMIEEFAIVCKCGQWYGWIDNIISAERIGKKYKKQGCSKCKGDQK